MNLKSYSERSTLVTILSFFTLTTLLILITVPYNDFSISANNTLINLTDFNLNNVTTSNNNNLLILKILAYSLESKLQGAASMLEFASNMPEMKSMPNTKLLNTTMDSLHGIPSDSDIQKRIIAQKVISYYPVIAGISFILPNGDTYFMEPYSLQSNQTKNNLGFREYFKGARASNDTYLGDIITSTSSGLKRAIIAVPVFANSDSNFNEGSNLTGIIAGSINLDMLNKELQSYNIPQGQRVVLVDSNDTKIADSEIRNFVDDNESFSNLKSYRNAIEGKSGSLLEKVNQEMMLVSYYPMDTLQNRWAILLMHPIGNSSNNFIGDN